MKRILLLAFIHGFRGSDFTFGDFPTHLKDTAANNLPDHELAIAIYPRYETRGELAQSTSAFLEWLKERVMELRKAHLEDPWPPNDRRVGVVLVAHSMGGFVASDCLFRILDDHRENGSLGPIFPLIQGILAFDTPLNGLARSMFVYGAFSNYNKVSNVFNIMTAISAATPAALSRLASKRAISTATGRISKRSVASSPAWKAWQLIAMRTGTVGVIAAGGVAAYMHRKKILEGVRTVRSLTKDDIVQGYQQSVDALGQGLAYINRGNVGESFAWLSDHFTFVGALLKQNELNRRLERLAALRGVGVCDVYASLGENGYWSGGYFVPERTFCAIPAKDEPEAKLFVRHVVEGATDEIAAHVGMFKKDKNKDYERMINDSAKLIVDWFNDQTELYDDPKFAEPPPAEPEETEAIAKVVDSEGVAQTKDLTRNAENGGVEDTEMSADDEVPDESPIDIAAAAALVPLPDDIEHDLSDSAGESGKTDQKKAYLRHLFGVAQSTGTSLRSYLPSKLPAVEMPKVSMPALSLPDMPPMPSMPSVSLPTRINPFARKPVVEMAALKTPDVEPAKPSDDAGQAGARDKKASIEVTRSPQ
ncbi:hypothetical protein N657DRAFT_626456 [Parathielavia appendiculata]|uniref:DUF676 domain-containing protein n=1 Tax=Parathielavia appendiculata TaxID=2587402 RepID=A0AAN6TRZ9_9PEZI|nr:hypothetical protein N657DRAFT_626456 [Parathielavia appendiculata]